MFDRKPPALLQSENTDKHVNCLKMRKKSLLWTYLHAIRPDFISMLDQCQSEIRLMSLVNF